MYASVSKLDSFALLRSTDWMDVERFVAQVKEPFRSTPQMDLGTEVHRFAEKRPVTEDDVITNSKLVTVEWDIANVVEVINSIPIDSAVEIPGSLEIDTSRWGRLWVPMRADGITGLQARDIKTTLKSFSPESYPDAYQWRFYLWGFGCRKFVYDLIKIGKDRQTGLYFLTRETPVTLWTYPGIEEDCRALVEDFLTTMERLDLLDYFLTKPEKEKKQNVIDSKT